MQSEFYAKVSRIIKPQYIHMIKYYTDINLYGMQENAQDKKKNYLKKIRIGIYTHLSMPVCKHVCI